jgi:DNA (cytosine-5)-methyltransferase 1
MNELALFAGAGGGVLGGKLLGWRTVCAVELDAYCRRVLLARQRDGFLPRFPIWDDVQTFDGRLWRGSVDVVSGGFPCQDISASGKGAGIEGERSGMWREMARIVGEVRPRFVFVENAPTLLIRGIERVASDLADMGFDCWWGTVGASDAGMDHKRKRFWLVADSLRQRRPQVVCVGQEGGATPGRWEAADADTPAKRISRLEQRLGQPGVLGTDDGLAHRVDRLKAIGNGQVPAVAALAWRLLGGPDGDCGGAA